MEIRNLRLVRFSCRFLIRQQLVGKYRTSILSIKYSIFFVAVFCCFDRQNHRAFKSGLGRNNALTLYTTAVYR